MNDDNKTTDLGNVIHIDDERIQDHLGRVVRSTVEETLNALLDAEADALTGGRPLRALGRPSGLPRWSPGSQAAHQGRRSDVEGAEAAQTGV